jgi:hypothetical protein
MYLLYLQVLCNSYYKKEEACWLSWKSDLLDLLALVIDHQDIDQEPNKYNKLKEFVLFFIVPYRFQVQIVPNMNKLEVHCKIDWTSSNW